MKTQNSQSDESGSVSSEVNTLIQQTFSDSRPDPYHAPDDMRGFLEQEIASFWGAASGPPAWEPGMADELADYLLDEGMTEEERDTRLEALHGGAELTQGEKDYLEDTYWNFDAIHDDTVYYLYEVQEETDEAPRSVYFLAENQEMGQYSDLIQFIGPFRSLEEVIEAVADTDLSPIKIDTIKGLDFDDGCDEEFIRLLEARYKGKVRIG